jgi:hypothetical protein
MIWIGIAIGVFGLLFVELIAFVVFGARKYLKDQKALKGEKNG